jgi:3-phenylpropionate/trans-cinnamate dioxygenase ferredoxin reductase component
METTKYLLVGGGVASVQASMAIRERDKEGRLMIVGNEKWHPYDRPPLSKQMLVDEDFTPDDASSKFDNYYPDNSIDLVTGVVASSLDTDARTVTLDDGRQVQYEKLLLATGAHIRVPDVPGKDLPDVYYLRYVDHSLKIREAIANSRRATVVGSSYMGMEVASGCISRGIETTIVDPSPHPWGKFASPDLGRFMKKAYEDKGAHFVQGKITGFEKQGEHIHVRTESGEDIVGNMAIACVGVELNTALAKSAGLEVDPVHGVVVDQYLRTADSNIYVAGDIACFEDVALGKRWHAEHFMNAKWQGKAAGANMAGENARFDQVAYFFSDFLDLHMILRGDPQAGKNTTVLGKMDSGDFVELYSDDQGMLRMGVGMSHNEKRLDPWADKLEELIRAKTPVASVKASDFGL